MGTTESTSLAHISAAKREIAKTTDLKDILEIRDKAEALRKYAKFSGETIEAQICLADVRLCAERRAGELLAEMESIHPGRPNGDMMSPLTEIGITKKQSSRWQLAAKLPDGDYEAMVSACRESQRELTQAAVLTAARKLVAPPKVEPLQTAKLDAVELVGELRMCIADFAEKFGPDRMDILINVLRAELVALEAGDDN